ncbi:hypothetical protein MKW94_011394 [Papaver nudicaule]|uniref:Uncharacterized protein n=1 Tax=Papaver nudicaule TaxID=74823 RepID=A0AA42B2M2_PAPNU|nr:hypothetical protein [Papaver nudicaule]
MEQYVKEAVRRKEYKKREKRMIGYVLARMTVDQVLAAEKAYKNRFNDIFPHGFIGYTAPVETSEGKSSILWIYWCGKSEDEKKALTSVKEKLEDLQISE